MRLFDSHCHLGLEPDEDPVAGHQRAQAAGVERLLLVGVDAASSGRARDLARRLPGLQWSAGLHPNASGALAAEWPALRALAAEPDCAAIGETGLDYHWQKASPEEQEASLQRHLQLARELGKPVILHCREAAPQLFAVLQDHAPVRGVMHCFAGDVAQARQALDLGLLLSFAGPLTYPRNDALRQAAAFAPALALLVETDAPFLPPQGRRGQRNEPAFLVTTLAELARLRGWSAAATAQVTWDNAVRLFGEPVGADGSGQRGPDG